MSDPAPPKRRRTLKERLAALYNRYGTIVVVTYLVLSLCTIAGFSIAIGIGAEPSTATGFLGVIVAGWIAAKATLPIRVLITLGLTPVVAFVVRRRRAAKPDDDDDDDDVDDASEAATAA